MELKTAIKEFKENIILLSLLCYGFGFFFNILYYYYFNIPIIYYLSINDLLLFAVAIIIPLLLLVFIFDLILLNFILWLLRFTFEHITKKKIDEVLLDFFGFILFILSFILIVKLFTRELFEFRFAFFFVIAIPICVNIKRHVLGKQVKLLYSDLISFLGMIIFGVYIISDISGTGVTSTYVSFNDKNSNESIDTGNNLDYTYVGETSGNIFIYNVETKVSSVYAKSDLNKLVYYDRKSKKDKKEAKSSKKFTFPFTKFYKLDKNTIGKNNTWIKEDSTSYSISFEQSPRGIMELFEQLKDITDDNQLNINKPTIDRSFLTNDTKNLQDFEKLNIAISRDAAEIEKVWDAEQYIVGARLNKKRYSIFILKLPKNWRKKIRTTHNTR